MRGYQQLNDTSLRFSNTKHKTCTDECAGASMERGNSKLLLSHFASSLHPFFAVFKIRDGGDKAKQITRSPGRKRGDRTRITRPNTRKFPMNLGGIFSICLVSFRWGLQLYCFELSMLGSPQKENAKVFAGPSMCLCEYSVPSVCHSVTVSASSDFSFWVLVTA